MTINYSKQVLLKRGNTTVSSTYTGPIGEITLDTDLLQLRVHDGTTQGGWVLPSGQDFIDIQNDLAVIGNVDISLLANVSTLLANANSQQTQIDGLTSNVSLLQNVDIALLANISTLLANANNQQTQINNLLTSVADFVTTGNIAPSTANETFWFNDADGRLYIKQGNVWTDSSPTVLPSPEYIFGVLENTAGNIVPDASNVYSLGSSVAQWKDIWVSNATIYFNSVPLSTDVSGNLTYNGNPLVSLIDGNLSVGGAAVGLNLFDQDLNANSAVTFYTVGATAINVSQINGTNPGGQLVIQAGGDHNWTFEPDGNLILPSNLRIVQSENVISETGTILVQDPDTTLQIFSTGTYGNLNIGYVEKPNAPESVAFMTFNSVHNEVIILVGESGGNIQTWSFTSDGKIALPPPGGLIGDTYGDFMGAGIQAPYGGYAILNSNNQQQYVEADDNAVYIGVGWPDNNLNWTFDLNGNLTIPGNIVYANGASILSDYATISSTLNTSTTSQSTNDFVGGNYYNADTLSVEYTAYTGASTLNFSIGYQKPLDGNIGINVAAISTPLIQSLDGTLTMPVNITGANVISASTFVSNSFHVVTAGNLSITSQYGLGTTGTILEDNGTLELIAKGGGSVVVGWDSTYGNGLGNLAVIGMNALESGGVGITTGNQNATIYNWVFNKTGELTFPTGGNVTFDSSAVSTIDGVTNINAVGNVTATNVSVSGNLTVANTLVNRVYLLEAYASETYTLPGSFTEDVCRYSYISNTVNVPSAWFNTSTYTFTPQKAGYWEITAAYDVYRNAESSMAIKKNTTIVASAGSFNAVAQQVTKIIYLNGSTDYIQIYNYGGAALERSQYETRSWFQARWVGA